MKAIILAAGEGTRMRSDRPKVLHRVNGKPMLKYVIDAVREAGASDIIVVVGHKAADVQAEIGNGVMYAEQHERLGTGHAVMCALGYISPGDEVLVVYGDAPLLTAECLSGLRRKHKENGNGVTAVSVVVPDPSGYGRIVYDGKKLRIIEHKDADAETLEINEINTGVYMFDGGALLHALDNLRNENAAGEYYLTDTVEITENAGVYRSDDWEQFIGVNDNIQLAEAARLMRHRINTRLMASGVNIIDPAQTYIDSDVKIGARTVVYPGAILEGASVTGTDCVIGAGTRLVNSALGNGVEVWHSVILDSKVGDFTRVGPFAYIRPGTEIGRGVRIGDFVEIKNSVIGDGAKVSHLTYVGDSDVGSGANLGCGVVTVNYDGITKSRTTVGENAFIGCNTNLLAPVTVGAGAYTAAGTTITEDVPDGALAVGRARQMNLPGRAAKYLKTE